MTLQWPPEYTMKRHPRARYVKLKASPQHGLEIVVPMRFNQKHIDNILELNKAWILKRLIELESAIQARQSIRLPESIYLRVIDETWSILYLKSDDHKTRLMPRQTKEIVILGNTDDSDICRRLLSAWLKMQAEIHLCRLLEKLSESTQLSFKKVSIRDQRSRWGSCTSKGSINLNYKLIFLPEELVRHILIHELCHTVHLNHSDKFWKLVSRFDPQWKQHNSEMRQADQWMPVWLP